MLLDKCFKFVIIINIHNRIMASQYNGENLMTLIFFFLEKSSAKMEAKSEAVKGELFMIIARINVYMEIILI